MNERRVVWAVAIVVVCLVAVGVANAAPGGQVLTVTDTRTGEEVLAAPVHENTSVTLTYTHSVERSQVVDAYEVRGGKLDMVRMEFQDYGAGLPTGADVHLENGTFVFDPNRTYESIVVKPDPYTPRGKIRGQTLRVGRREYYLANLSDGHGVELAVENRSMLQATLGRIEG